MFLVGLDPMYTLVLTTNLLRAQSGAQVKLCKKSDV